MLANGVVAGGRRPAYVPRDPKTHEQQRGLSFLLSTDAAVTAAGQLRTGTGEARLHAIPVALAAFLSARWFVTAATGGALGAEATLFYAVHGQDYSPRTGASTTYHAA